MTNCQNFKIVIRCQELQILLNDNFGNNKSVIIIFFIAVTFILTIAIKYYKNSFM